MYAASFFLHKVDMINATCKMLVRRERLLGRPRHREDNIKMDLNETGGDGGCAWDQQQALVSMATNIQ
jgi:hypothetical protein